MTEKKNGDYQKPESHGAGDELEEVSGALARKRKMTQIVTTVRQADP
jgi:hypothetical protein